MIILLIVLFLLILTNISITTIQLNYSQKVLDIKIILFYVIKIKLKDKTNRNKKNTDGSVETKNIIIMLLKLKKPLLNFVSTIKLKISIDGTYQLPSPNLTAMSYGFINALVYITVNYLNLFLNELIFNLNLKPVWSLCESNFNINSEIKFRNINIFGLIFKLLPIIIKNKKLLKKVE